MRAKVEKGMAGTDLEYGWYKWQDGFRQRDGFFVDRAGRVLYWPSRSASGYVVTEREVEEIQKQKRKEGNGVFSTRLRAFFLFAAIVSIYCLIEKDYYLFHLLYKYAEFWIPVAGILGILLYRARAPRRDGIDLSHLQKVAARRPPTKDFLISAKARPAGEFWAPIGFGVTGLLALAAFVGARVRDDVIGFLKKGVSEDILGAAALLLLLVAGLLYSGFRGVRRIRARYALHSLEDLTSRIKVTEDLTLEKLMDTKDRTEPLPRARVAAEYQQPHDDLVSAPRRSQPPRGYDPGRGLRRHERDDLSSV